MISLSKLYFSTNLKSRIKDAEIKTNNLETELQDFVEQSQKQLLKSQGF